MCRFLIMRDTEPFLRCLRTRSLFSMKYLFIIVAHFVLSVALFLLIWGSSVCLRDPFPGY